MNEQDLDVFLEYFKAKHEFIMDVRRIKNTITYSPWAAIEIEIIVDNDLYIAELLLGNDIAKIFNEDLDLIRPIGIKVNVYVKIFDPALKFDFVVVNVDESNN